jgi:putative transcriptional regulator
MNLDKGNQLIAHPSILGDYSFGRSVVIITHKDINDGYVGFVVNKKLAITIDELIPEVTASIPVYEGGPVESDHLNFIHRIKDIADSSIEISNGLYWGGNIEVIKDWVRVTNKPERYIRFFMGYSGWDVGQLEDEVAQDVWLIDQNNDIDFFNKDNRLIWKEKINQVGGELAYWQNAPDNPGYN